MERPDTFQSRKPASFRFGTAGLLFGFIALLLPAGQSMLESLARNQDFRSLRISSHDRGGGNRDSIAIGPDETAVLAEIEGPAAIHHIWVTIAAEPFYGRKVVLKIYWDGEETPSVEAPIGDFFGVGHGLNRDFSSLPINCSSEGRARNCYWYMPFRRSCRITATNEGSRPVAAFYYYIDYRTLEEIPSATPYFHAQYRQEFPCSEGRNYLILEAAGNGHYVGTNLSVLQNSLGWWGEGDDMIFVDGENSPSLHGTGSEDYFSDAWGMREAEGPFYGCPLQEEDYQAGSKATVYRFHIPDPIPFSKSIRVTIEHGHANDRSDHYSSVAYWYQAEPHVRFAPLPPVDRRLPFALESPDRFIFPAWKKEGDQAARIFMDRENGLRIAGPGLVPSLTAYYDGAGRRYPVVSTEGASETDPVRFSFPIEVGDLYALELYFLQGPNSGDIRIRRAPESVSTPEPRDSLGTFHGFSSERRLSSIRIDDLLLNPGENTLLFEPAVCVESGGGAGMDIVGLGLVPSARRFIGDWNLIGPFPAADMNDLQTPYPPERVVDFAAKYQGKDGVEISWRVARAGKDGYMDLASLIVPSERGLVYGMAYVFSPDDRRVPLLVGSDDGVKIWINGGLVHANPAYRAAAPDQDKVMVDLKKGWNSVLIKVLQGAGGWGFFVRFADPEKDLRWSTWPDEIRKP